MPRSSPYSDEQKAKIIDVVKAAKKKGSWMEALSIAKDAGYKGGLGYLMKLAGPQKRRGRGRPKGSGRKLGRPAGRPAARKSARHGKRGNLANIDRIVQREVQARLRRAQAAAIAAFEHALR